ncbi:hypothetical protein [Chitinophaga nivalis]|uniref:Acetoacetate decarboxylase (ADC) n=1 Tax=Chitinophaga nivalis TaxID=2991709 RepID=A0ABT3IJA4_9BACT|nr:hypothetical protein [Chitinophaga nivalis]MCW3466269.1 hypothetical protein [Chitinophaga nivalis]MCW3484040.1 hypothetical protein [Chitinophaga nivalis]
MGILKMLIMVTGMQIHAGGNPDSVKPKETIIDLAGHRVPVMKDGLYDRYRSNPPLSVIASAAPEIDLSWFKTLAKKKVDMGFESYSPNFYYKNSSITAIFTANLSRLKALMPPEVLATVKPIAIWPNRGLVAITAYAYHYCDNDTYNEVSISIVTTKPGSAKAGVFTLLRQLKAKDLWGYVLKLPVNTELAMVRGRVGYNLPKWLTAISYQETNQSVRFDIADNATGKTDMILEGKKMYIATSGRALVRTNFINLNQQHQLTHGYTDVRQLEHASSAKRKNVTLTLTDGGLSALLRSLKLGKMIRYDYLPDFQAALYAPELIHATAPAK